MFRFLANLQQNNKIQTLNFTQSQLFGKWSKPKKQPQRMKEKIYQQAVLDDKAIKLTKAEEDQLNKRKKLQQMAAQTTLRTLPINSQSVQWESKVSKEKLRELYFKQLRQIDGITSQVYKPIQENIDEEKQLKQARLQEIIPLGSIYPTPNTPVQNEVPHLRQKVINKYENSERVVNMQYWDQIQKNKNPPLGSKRTGILAKKVGMTSVWDKWGHRKPLTVLQVDRCQVVQVKTLEKDGVNALQLGIGEKNLKSIKKPQLGHFMKANVPPKEEVQEFKVDKDNLLPVGFQLSVRHFTPGQFVDVSGTSRGLGFQGVIFKWGYSKQCSSHGTSLTHRSIGSTGQHQDPGKVVKGKKMHGQMGNKPHSVLSLQVYKIDATRSLIYVKGAVPGRVGSVIRIRDAYKKVIENEKYVNYPTFIPEKGVEYAEEIIAQPPEDDPEEIYLHDNDVID